MKENVGVGDGIWNPVSPPLSLLLLSPSSALVRPLCHWSFPQAFLLLVVDFLLLIILALHIIVPSRCHALILPLNGLGIMWSLQCVYISPVGEFLFSTFVISGFSAPSLSFVAGWTSGLKTLFLSYLSLSLSLSLSFSIHSIPPCPPLAQNYRRQLLWGHSLRCKLSSLSSCVPSPVLVLGRCALAMGDLPGVEIVSHQLRAVALTGSAASTLNPNTTHQSQPQSTVSFQNRTISIPLPNLTHSLESRQIIKQVY